MFNQISMTHKQQGEATNTPAREILNVAVSRAIANICLRATLLKPGSYAATPKHVHVSAKIRTFHS